MGHAAYYNEIDPRAAAWLRELIRQRHIAPGDVDERSIEDVVPTELAGYTQCHFFAGIGVWSYALRQAGWSDDRPVWTGSCPCQPFSSAGKGDGFADERHLWPAWFHLILNGKPADVPVFGEQVASKDGLAWLDLVLADLEGAGYACGALDLCAAGFGSPNIRQRIYFGAERLGDAWCEGLEGYREGSAAESGRFRKVRPVAPADEFCRVADTKCDGHDRAQGDAAKQGGHRERDRLPIGGCEELRGTDRPGPTNGLWRDTDWLFCRDGKWRPVEPGTFPLAHGAPARVGRLRGYGNAINAEVAKQFIRAWIEVTA